MTYLKRLWNDECGQDLIEYTLLLAFVALVAAGLADLTFTLTPKNEWDVAAGVALVTSAGGYAGTLDGTALRCNNRSPLLSGLVACGPGMRDELMTLIRDARSLA